MRTVLLIGNPVGHSVSPPMQQAAFDAAGLELRYAAVRVGTEGLREAFRELRRDALGLNVTRPLKEAVIPLLDSLSVAAMRGGSVNTVVFRDGRAEGHCTDGTGFMNALRRRGGPKPARAVVVGTGGAARAVAAALLDEGCAVVVTGRNIAAGEKLAHDLGRGCTFAPNPLRPVEPDLLVNAIPVGGNGPEPLLPEVRLHPGLTVFDLVYLPRETPLLRRARTAGCPTVEGIEMLIEQGALSFELWTGVPAPVHVMRTAAYRALSARGDPVVTG